MKYYINSETGSAVKLNEDINRGFQADLLMDQGVSYGVTVTEKDIKEDDLMGFAEVDQKAYDAFINEKLTVYTDAYKP